MTTSARPEPFENISTSLAIPGTNNTSPTTTTTTTTAFNINNTTSSDDVTNFPPPTPPFLLDVAKRNTAMGSLVVVLTILSVPVILQAKLKLHVQMSLLNLAAGNFLLAASGAVYGAVYQPHYSSDQGPCQVVVMMIVFSFLIIHTSGVLISANTYFAVRFPFRYVSLDHRKVNGVAILCAWTLTAVLTLMLSTFWKFRRGIQCNPVTLLNRMGFLLYGLIMFCLDLCVLVLSALVGRILIVNNNTLMNVAGDSEQGGAAACDREDDIGRRDNVKRLVNGVSPPTCHRATAGITTSRQSMETNGNLHQETQNVTSTHPPNPVTETAHPIQDVIDTGSNNPTNTTIDTGNGNRTNATIDTGNSNHTNATKH